MPLARYWTAIDSPAATVTTIAPAGLGEPIVAIHLILVRKGHIIKLAGLQAGRASRPVVPKGGVPTAYFAAL